MVWFCLEICLCTFNPNVYFLTQKCSWRKGTISTSKEWDGRTSSGNLYFTFIMFGKSSYFTSGKCDGPVHIGLDAPPSCFTAPGQTLVTAASQGVSAVCYLSIYPTIHKLFESEIYFYTPNWIQYLTYDRNWVFYSRNSTNMNNWIEFSMTVSPHPHPTRNRSSQFWEKKVLKALELSFF